MSMTQGFLELERMLFFGWFAYVRMPSHSIRRVPLWSVSQTFGKLESHGTCNFPKLHRFFPSWYFASYVCAFSKAHWRVPCWIPQTWLVLQRLPARPSLGLWGTGCSLRRATDSGRPWVGGCSMFTHGEISWLESLGIQQVCVGLIIS